MHKRGSQSMIELHISPKGGDAARCISLSVFLLMLQARHSRLLAKLVVFQYTLKCTPSLHPNLA